MYKHLDPKSTSSVHTFVLSRLVQLQSRLDDVYGLQAARLNGASHGTWHSSNSNTHTCASEHLALAFASRSHLSEGKMQLLPVLLVVSG